ncbi:MAG: DUF6443 domain-containing protein [Paludibacter sp.]|nr:DUF6443 domain-containing protein [Paludibacter sp.]
MMKTIITLAAIICILFGLNTFAQDNSQNYISIHTKMDSLGVAEMVEIQYFDGLGRPVQKTSKEITPTGKDLVTKIEYDYCGRVTKNWLPAPFESSAGYINSSNFSNGSKMFYGNDRPYSENKYFEGSWYDKLIGEQMPGVDLGGRYKFISKYPNSQNSIAKFVVKNGILERSGYYDEKTLIYNSVTDEDGKISLEYKDKQDRVVMKRNGLDVDTYFVFNDLGQLSYILPPIAVDNLKNFSINTSIPDNNDNLKKYGYLYKYDARGNCTEKRLPGCEPILMVYDKADRMVLSQDGNQRTRIVNGGTEWTATKYDMLGRVIFIGIMYRTEIDISLNYKSIRDVFVNELVVGNYTANNFSSCTPLTEDYYDNYSFLTPQSSLNFVSESGYDAKHTSAIGLQTGSRVYTLGNPNQSTTSVIYYDYRGRVVQTRSTNHLGGLDLVYNHYNFTGQVVKSLKKHTANGQPLITEVYVNEYDNALRLKKTTYKINDKQAVILNDMTEADSYDELGLLRKKKRHNNVDSEEIDYNIRNWTTRMKSGTFEEKLYYSTNPANSTPCFNGNISYSTWMYNGFLRGYAYNYDQLNRLNSSMFAENHYVTDDFYYYMESFNYDKMGNIIQLTRNGSEDTNDQLFLTYNGNQLKNVWDGYGSRNQYNLKEYQDKAQNGYNTSVVEMAYDANGNLIKDLDRDIVTIKYNLLNLPEIIQFKNGNQIRNTYDANGQKLKTRNYTVYDYTLQPIVAENTIRDVFLNEEVYVDGTDYVGNVEYHYDAEYFSGEFSWQQTYLSMLHNPEGYCQNLNYVILNYFRRDHLGNNREVWRAPFSVGSTNYAATTTQRTQYYPSGLPWASNAGDNPWVQHKKFNGCEFIEMHGLDVTNLGNRSVHNAKNRFDTMDRFCEKFPWQSPYVHAGNNPVNYVDVKGDSAAVLLYPGAVGHMAILIQNDNGKWSYYSVNGDDLYKSTNGLLGNKKFDEIGTVEFNSPADFLKSEFNQLSNKENDTEKANYEFSEAYILPATKDQDKKMSETFENISKKKYDVFTNNCATAVQEALASVGYKITTKDYVPIGMYGTSYTTIETKPIRPNTAFNTIIKNNPQGIHLKLYRK